MKITVLMPTITGREESCALMCEHYRNRSGGFELQFLLPKDYRNWPSGINAAASDVEGAFVIYAADDLEPLDGWADAMLECLQRGEIPAPQVWDYVVEGDPVNQGVDGPPGAIPEFTRVPALTRELAEMIGPWPEIDYFSDCWLSDKARTLGVETRVTAGFSFVHHWHQVGRLDAGDWTGRSLPAYQAAKAALG